MKLGAIIIESHEYLTSKPEILTFGTKFNYSINFDDNTIFLKITSNATYIPSFFKVNESVLENLSAVVGKNGIGKTTLLNLIRGIINNTEYEFPQNESLIIIEKNEIPYIFHNNLSKKLKINFEEQNDTLKPFQGYLKTIYYSPVFNYSYNQNHDIDESFDISFDNILYHDLVSARQLENTKNGWEFSPNEELIFKNSLRQLDFLKSRLINNTTISQLFEINYPNQFKIYIRGYNSKEEDWNTPMQFRPILNLLKETLENEIRNWHTIRNFDKKNRVLNQIEINKYLLKRYSIRAFLTVLFEKMEQKNTFLQEGNINFDKEKLKDSTALEIFSYFIENAEIDLRGANKNIFNSKIVIQLIEKLYSTIDKIENEELVQNDFVYANFEDVTSLLELQKSFISDLSNYFYLFYKEENKNLEQSDRVEGFLHFYPFDKKLSSGQHSFLNIFSRLYQCLSNLDNNKINTNTHFVLLLDEGDLTFHPNWKRKYINILIESIPIIFKEIFKQVTVEIVLTTHDPLTLSDIPKGNVNYLISKNGKSSILSSENEIIPNKTFGANISEILAHSYFLEDGLIGDFSYNMIRSTIDWLNNNDTEENHEYYYKVIQIIDEPIVQLKLSEMYDAKMNTKIQIQILDEQIKKLQLIKNKLK